MPRFIWLMIGLTAVALGVAGTVLPLLPTVPFLLLAAFAFARSSPRFHQWLMNHPKLGPPIRDWQAEGAISRRAKIAALIAMGAALGISIALGLKLWVLALQAAVLIAVATFILTRPEPKR